MSEMDWKVKVFLCHQLRLIIYASCNLHMNHKELNLWKWLEIFMRFRRVPSHCWKYDNLGKVRQFWRCSKLLSGPKFKDWSKMWSNHGLWSCSQDFIKRFYDIWPHWKVMDLEMIFHLRNSFPPIGDQFWLRIKRIWTGNRVYNSSSYYSIVSFRIQISVSFIHQFQVDGKMKLHSLTPEIKSTFNQMWYPGENCWNIENSSILLSLKTCFVF